VPLHYRHLCSSSFSDYWDAKVVLSIVRAALPAYYGGSAAWHRRTKKREIAGKFALQSRLVDSVSEAPASVEIGRFRILPHRREVFADGRPIELGGRAFDVLMALIEANGAVVGKDELISRAWPGRIIEEGNLRAQIKALRIALADHDLIRTLRVAATNSPARCGLAARAAELRWSMRLPLPQGPQRHACRSWFCPLSV
jgi:DNA-binding response OmpR family regulator